MTQEKRWVVTAIAVVGALLAWRWISRAPTNADDRERAASSADPPAAVTRVERRTIANTLKISGEFKPFQDVDVHAKVAGYIKTIYVDVGSHVKQGQALIHIDPRQYKNSWDQAEGALATAKAQYAGQRLAAEIAKKNFPALLEQAKAQLESAKANLAKTQADYDRQISLRKPATTQQDVDQATTALWQAEAQVKLAEADAIDERIMQQPRRKELNSFIHVREMASSWVKKNKQFIGSNE